MLPVPWAVGERGQGLTEGQRTWGHRLVSQPSQRTSSLFQSPSGPSSRYSKGPRAGASPWPATPGVQAEPLLSPWGLMGGDRSCLILSLPGRSPEAGRTLRANTVYRSGTVPQGHPDQTPPHHGPHRLLQVKPQTSHRREAAPPAPISLGKGSQGSLSAPRKTKELKNVHLREKTLKLGVGVGMGCGGESCLSRADFDFRLSNISRMLSLASLCK